MDKEDKYTKDKYIKIYGGWKDLFSIYKGDVDEILRLLAEFQELVTGKPWKIEWFDYEIITEEEAKKEWDDFVGTEETLKEFIKMEKEDQERERREKNRKG